MNEQKWVGVLTFRELEKGKWYIPIICANVKSKLRKVKGNENVYKGIGRKLLTYLEHDVKEIKDNDQICLYHDPDNMGMKELAKKLGYHSQPGNKGSKAKGKNQGRESRESLQEAEAIRPPLTKMAKAVMEMENRKEKNVRSNPTYPTFRERE